MTAAAGDEGDLQSLYPFLYSGTADLGPVLDEVRRSTAEKAREIVALRSSLASRYAGELAGCARQMAAAFAAGGRLYAFGNGGSSTDAQDVARLFLHPPAPSRAVPAISLTSDVAVLTALSNDIGFEVVYARQLAAFGRPGDIAVGLSTSGGSANVLRAFDEASRRGLLTVAAVGLADVSANALFALASGHGLLSIVSVLGSLYPVTTVLLAHLLLGERLTRLQLGGVGVALAGVAALSVG